MISRVIPIFDFEPFALVWCASVAKETRTSGNKKETLSFIMRAARFGIALDVDGVLTRSPNAIPGAKQVTLSGRPHMLSVSTGYRTPPKV